MGNKVETPGRTVPASTELSFTPTIPLGRKADNGQSQKVFSDMSGEKVPMCADNYDDETKDLGDVNKSQKAQRVGDDGTTTGDNENEDANLPPNGRVMGGTSASVSNEFTHSFEGGKHIVAESASGRIIKDSSANEKIYRGSN